MSPRPSRPSRPSGASRRPSGARGGRKPADSPARKSAAAPPSKPAAAPPSKPAAAPPGKPVEPPAPDRASPPAPGWLARRLTAIPERVREIVLMVTGTIVSIWAALLLAVAGAFLTPLRIGAVLVPVSLVLGIGGNLAIMWFAYRVTANRFLGVLPGLVWLVLTFIASGSTKERDLVLYQGNWVAIAYLFGGSATVAVVAYRMFNRRRSS